MPPSARSNAPEKSATAPVKAPRAWPNSSLSIRSRGIAPQSTTTNGRGPRGPSSWIASATSSLPVPVSPWINTVAVDSATRVIWANNRRMASLSPTRRPHRVELLGASGSVSSSGKNPSSLVPMRTTPPVTGSCAASTRAPPK